MANHLNAAMQHARNIIPRSTPTLDQRSTTTTNETASAPTGTIAEFATALNGVNQPMNDKLRIFLWWSLGIVAMTILTFRGVQRLKAHLRHIQAMGQTNQTYWSRNRYGYWKFKKYLTYAPLVGKRHNREFRLAPGWNMGTLPSRLHALQITAFILSNIAYLLLLDYTKPNVYSVIAELRGRSGVLAVVNMIPLFIFAGRNNPLITLLQISFDTYNLMHRWIGRMAVVHSVIHTLAWAYVKFVAGGFMGKNGHEGIWHQLGHDPFASWGMVATVAMIVIFITAFSPIRHAFYETFLGIHIIMAILSLVGIYIHCYVAGLPQLPYIQAICILWGLERLGRFIKVLVCNWSFRKGVTYATIEALPGEAVRVTMHLPKKVSIKPGSHAYLRFASINPLECHPFSIAWVEDRQKLGGLPTSEKRGHALRNDDVVTDVSFVVQAQGGFTRKLYNKASLVSPRFVRVKAAMEGPYGGHHSLDSYGTTLLFAGASGITHQIPFVQHLVRGFNDGTIATRKIILIWVVRDTEHLEWVRPWMDIILRMPQRRNCLTIRLFITRPKGTTPMSSPSTTVRMQAGRPNVMQIVRDEAESQVGAMAVTVCGPGALADNVREAVLDVQEVANVDFIEESFTW